ncbi:MAG: DUF5683 domain-containing protein [Bacteroidota bacterium]
MKLIRNIFFFIAILLFCIPAIAQKSDTVKIKHSATKASVMSAILPGSGQVYNRKYWKVPVLYIGLGTLTYFLSNNYSQYQLFRKAYQYRTDGITTTIDNQPLYSDEQLKINRDIYRGNLELSVILTTALYVINIVDASVDAHLYKFDISEDLSLNVSPTLIQASPFSLNQTAGLSLKLKF